MVKLRYGLWRWLAPRLPYRRLRVWAWDRKWALWFRLYDDHVLLWEQEL
jgi:hypothetical protein